MDFDINLKFLSGKNIQKVNKQNIQDSQNWVFDELNEISVKKCFGQPIPSKIDIQNFFSFLVWF